MPFIKGVSGNMAGKPIGALNKKTIEQIDRAGRVLELIETEFLEKDIAKLTPSQRMSLYTDMMEKNKKLKHINCFVMNSR